VKTDVTLREVHRLKEFENRASRRILAAKRDKDEDMCIIRSFIIYNFHPILLG
jgi:hypothetical protein